MAHNDNLQELRNLIAMVLNDCDKYDYPHVCNMASDPTTRASLDKKILDICVSTGWPVQAAILQVERAYNPNMLDD